MGDWCYIGDGTRIWSAQHVEIGDRVLISFDCFVTDSLTHPLEASRRHQQFVDILTIGHPKAIDLAESKVVISSDAWLGARVVVLRGVTIGRGAIVGAGSVVTKDVPAWTVVAGNPARIIRHLDPENIAVDA